jgi:arylsulfatase A-like enzyme
MRLTHPLWLLLFTFTAAAAKQNILLIIADDYGVDSSSLYNSTNTGASLPPTPNIASLVTSGVLFSRACAYPICSPTRSCLLTGQFGYRTGVGDVIENGPALTASAFTLPEAFANAGLPYALAQFGKWHLATGPTTPRTVGGWTNYAGNLNGAIANYTNWTKSVNGVNTANYTNYATTDLVDDATKWISARGTNAWFVWAAFNAPHTPLHNPPPLLCPSYPLNTLTNSRRQFEAMVEAMDTEIGRLLTAVNRTNTHIIFLGDNGTDTSVIEPTYLSSRAKNTLYEGGTHVPLIISGPAVVNPNRTNATPANMVDVFATILELAGSSVAAAVPATVTIDGQSLMPVLMGTNTLSRYGYAEQFSTNNPTAAKAGRALQDGRYKLISFAAGRQEFYDLQSDPFESTNLLNTAMSATPLGNYYALVMKLGDYQLALSPPVITEFAKTNAQFAVTVQRNLTNSYGLWRAVTLDGLSWAPLTNAAVVTNGTGSVTLTDSSAPTTQAFYRVMAE